MWHSTSPRVVEFPVHTADLCEVHVSPVPTAVLRVGAHIAGAGDMYIASRRCFEDHALSPYWPRWFTLRIHAVSEANSPMGYRDVVIPANLFDDTSWLPLA